MDDIGVPVCRTYPLVSGKEHNGVPRTRPLSANPSPKLSSKTSYSPCLLDDHMSRVKKAANAKFKASHESNEAKMQEDPKSSWDTTSLSSISTSKTFSESLDSQENENQKLEEVKNVKPQEPLLNEQAVSLGTSTIRNVPSPCCSPPMEADRTGQNCTLKSKSPTLASVCEALTTMSPPPAKKLALSAKKVSSCEDLIIFIFALLNC
ncbi:hypothetical protein AB205_0065390 [Aquarana catesbeiana]|uniref:Uncharacterized protein n=1 Tax=Aquarana catesbeiana TaxID=8400 RepID=A0A2G9QLC9_AQUCT|nr:hypothetical protein AB205_0065390 [Aquarana catesbeiana]